MNFNSIIHLKLKRVLIVQTPKVPIIEVTNCTLKAILDFEMVDSIIIILILLVYGISNGQQAITDKWDQVVL